MEKIIRPEILNSVADVSVSTIQAYYMEAINGGWQLRRLTVQEDIVLADDKVEDPDGWPEVLGYLETEFTKEHFKE